MDVSTDDRPEGRPDNRADNRADGRWMSLKELADARRISVASAARLMRRRRWRRQPGNDGHIRVWVPAGEQEPKAEAWRDDRTDSHPDTLADLRSGVMEVIRPLQDAIAVLEAQLTEANARAVRADDRADVLRQQLDAARTEATHAAARTEAAEEEARKAQDAAEALRQRERAWWGQGRWARLRAAWRGQ